MLGWSIHIKCDSETVLHAESHDLSLDQKVRARAKEILDSATYKEWGYGYPNQYLIRNDQLPRVELCRFYKDPKDSHRWCERITFDLGPLPDIPGDKLLWVELWDQS